MDNFPALYWLHQENKNETHMAAKVLQRPQLLQSKAEGELESVSHYSVLVWEDRSEAKLLKVRAEFSFTLPLLNQKPFIITQFHEEYWGLL